MGPLASFFSGIQTADAIAASAAVVALFAMAATFWQVKLAREHNRLSVRPHLNVLFSAYPDKTIYLSVQNSGLGPAIVRSLHVGIDGVEYSSSTASINPALRSIFDAAGQRVNWTLLGPESPIRVEGTITLFEFIEADKSTHGFNAALAFARRMSIRIEYKSMYGERFTLTALLGNY
jgi:hypothetical protein